MFIRLIFAYLSLDLQYSKKKEFISFMSFKNCELLDFEAFLLEDL